jgi:hypothetical protein
MDCRIEGRLIQMVLAPLRVYVYQERAYVIHHAAAIQWITEDWGLASKHVFSLLGPSRCRHFDKQ